MNAEEKALILRCLELIEELIDNEPPVWASWDRHPWEQQMAHGPRYAVGRWFGPLRERDRMRYRRAIDTLEARGLVTSHRAFGLRLTNVALTSDGVTAAEQLREQAASEAEASSNG